MPPNACQHGAPMRGLLAAQVSHFQGRFGRLFPHLPAAKFGKSDAESQENLTALAKAMISSFDPPRDTPDEEESGIPALYTYFGQFIDHDLTFDPTSVLTKQQDPDALRDFRSPAFDLDNLYGRGPDDQPYLYDGLKFQLGDVITGEGVRDAWDLPRFRGRALIGDPRNDENSIVSQLQGLFLRFHNRMVDDNPHLTFQEVQERVRFHYQYVVLNDFLERIVSKAVLTELKLGEHYHPSKFLFVDLKRRLFMPVEYSVACYRLGHSLVRPGYRLNDNDQTLLPIFPIEKLTVGLTGFRTLAAGHAIDWARFIDIEKRPYGKDIGDATVNHNPDNKVRLQFAYRMDTALVDPLSNLPPSVATPPPSSLALRNLERAWRFGLPSGQAVAKTLHIRPLEDAEIIIGQAVDGGDPDAKTIDKIADGAFAGNCPLWTYILAESAKHRTAMPIDTLGGPPTINTPQLGPVGGRIVAEVILGFMFDDKTSLLSRDPWFQPVTGPDFKLKDIVNYALGHGPQLH